MSFLYMAPCPPPFLAANEFQQHAYSRNLSKDIVLALMIICHIPEDLGTPGTTPSNRSTSTSDVNTSTSSYRPTSTSDVETTTTSTPSNLPTSTSNVKPTFTGVLTTTHKSAPSEKWFIPTVVIIPVAVAGLVIIIIVCLRRQKSKQSSLSTRDIKFTSDGAISTNLERSKNTEKECPGTYRHSINTIKNASGNVLNETNTFIEIHQTFNTDHDNGAYINEDSKESKDTTDHADNTRTDGEKITKL